jgi:hypothetical protein
LAKMEAEVGEVVSLIGRSLISLFVIVVYLKLPMLLPSDYFLVEKIDWGFSFPLFHSNFRQSYFASRNGKGAVAFRGNRPSDAFSFLPCSLSMNRLVHWTKRFAKNWHAPRWPDPG